MRKGSPLVCARRTRKHLVAADGGAHVHLPLMLLAPLYERMRGCSVAAHAAAQPHTI